SSCWMRRSLGKGAVAERGSPLSADTHYNLGTLLIKMGCSHWDQNLPKPSQSIHSLDPLPLGSKVTATTLPNPYLAATHLGASFWNVYSPWYFLRLRHRVDESISRICAASSRVAVRARTRRMCSRSIVSNGKSPPSCGSDAACVAIRSGNACGSITWA